MSGSGFEGHRLNDMIDLVESARPGHLEDAGAALGKARDAIRDAAKELGDHIDRVEWEGESGDAFRKWSKKLVNHTHLLADFADTAGVHIATAATGLASVRSAMPPRDTRPVPKTVDELEAPKRIAGNPEYHAALQAEEHRQEAINQINRLSSYYSTSAGSLAQQEPPVFEPMPDVGVPRPSSDWVKGGSGASGVGYPPERLTQPPTSGGAPTQVPDPPVTPSTGPHSVDEGLPPSPHVGTEIDSVSLPPTTAPGQHAMPPGPSPTGPQPQPFPMTAGPPTPSTYQPPGNTRLPTSGAPRPVNERMPAPRSGGPTAGRPPTGLSKPAGESMPGAGRQGPSSGRSPISGRPISTGRPPAGRSATTPSGGRPGIVGGKPARTSGPGTAPSQGGAIGNERQSTSERNRAPTSRGRAAGTRLPGTSSGQAALRGNADGVTGKPLRQEAATTRKQGVSGEHPGAPAASWNQKTEHQKKVSKSNGSESAARDSEPDKNAVPPVIE